MESYRVPNRAYLAANIDQKILLVKYLDGSEKIIAYPEILVA